MRSGRRADRQEPAEDVLSPRAQAERGFDVVSLPADFDGDALRDRTTPPPDLATFREQYGVLLRELGDRKRRIVEDLASGGETQEVADQHGVTAGRVSQIRREAEQCWNRIKRGEQGR